MSSPAMPRSRRAVLVGVALAGVGSVSACSVRLQRDAPAIPGIRTQGPPPDTAAFHAALASSLGLQNIAVTEPKPWGPRLTVMHRQQVTRLLAVMRSNGISPSMPSASPSASPSTSTSTAALGYAEFLGVDTQALQNVRSSTPTNTAMFAALLASYTAAATVVGPAPAWVGLQPTQGMAVTLIPAVRRAVYALEIIAARTPDKDRYLVGSSVLIMSAQRSRLEKAAGASAPPAPLSYRLPIAPINPATSSALARTVLAAVSQAAARSVDAHHGSVDVVRAVVREWAEPTALGWRWGAPLAPFPGLAS
ncbi:MAG: hypothetical protein M3Y49_04055 [Actinomycetota bacterium]|nr:hypothetical protein [Actinomycetota bacterium]